MTRPLLYIAAPWKTRTLAEASLTHYAIGKAMGLGWAPIFTPLLFRDFLSDANENERAIAIECNAPVLAACHAILTVGDRITSGMAAELAWWKTAAWDTLPNGCAARVVRWFIPGPFTLITLRAPYPGERGAHSSETYAAPPDGPDDGINARTVGMEP